LYSLKEIEMDDLVWIVLIVALLIYYLYKLKHGRDPKEELLKAKQLLDEGLIDSKDYEKLKAKLLKKIIDDGWI
jgi:hypothetical protein